MTPVPAPADRRFRRAHVSPVRRPWRPAWRRWVRAVVVAVLAAYGLWRAADLVLTADALLVQEITITGNVHLSRGEVLALLDGLQRASLVTVQLDVWRQKLLRSPWVADAALRRRLPGGVQVVIAERQPMALGRIGTTLYLIDADGTLIDEFGPRHAGLDLPIVDGLGPARPAGDLLVDPARVALGARLLADLRGRPDLAARISQIDVSNPRDAVVMIEGDTALVHLGHERFAERVQSYLDLAPALRERVPDIDSVDLRFDERVYVRPHPEGRTAGPAASGAGESEGQVRRRPGA